MDLRLTNLCLDTIADNFERYNLVFITTKDENMKRKLKFLQRKYSLDLLTRFEDYVPEEFIDVLINKYVKVLDTTWFSNCSWEKTTSKFAEIGCNIEKITFKDVYIEEICEETPWQDIICHLPNLKSFTFRPICPCVILRNVAKLCPNIEEIEISSQTITVETTESLALCTKLKKICLEGTIISEDCVKYLLINLRSLEIFDYIGLSHVLYTMHIEDLSHLDEVEPYNITTLTIWGYFDNILKICLSTCPHLKSLTCHLKNEEEFIYFSKLSDLEQLSIECILDSKINISRLLKTNGGKLTSLTVMRCTLSVSVLAESCPRLKELILYSVDFHFNDDLKSSFNSLSSFTFQYYNASTSARAISLFLSSSARLETLSFRRSNLLFSEIKACILKCCELYPIKKISFWKSKIEKEWIKDLLLNCHTLSHLNIDRCFDSDDEDELLKFAEILPNKPEIGTGDDFKINEKYICTDYEAIIESYRYWTEHPG